MNMDIVGSTPPPRARISDGVLIVGNSLGASFSNPVDLDDDMTASYVRSTYGSRSLSQYEEETIIALDEEWTRATKEYNPLCTDELPDVFIASVAGDQSPLQSSKAAFWSTFVGVDPSNLGDDNIRMAWDALNKRRLMRRGLSSIDVDVVLPNLLTHSDFSMWTVSQVESFFRNKAHPDWTTWDRLDLFLGVSVIELDAADIRERLVTTQMDSAISVDSIGPMLERYQKWQGEENRNRTDLVQAEIVRAYWRKEELWRSYQNCNFRFRVLAEY
jgi:hypothetical protein